MSNTFCTICVKCNAVATYSKQQGKMVKFFASFRTLTDIVIIMAELCVQTMNDRALQTTTESENIYF